VVGGRAAILHHLDFGDSAWNKQHKIRHNGTFNANPLSAAAGVATLEHIRDGVAGEHALTMANQLIAGLNEVLRVRQLRGWAAYGDGSIFHLIVGSSLAFEPGILPNTVPAAELKQGGNQRILAGLRLALINRGIDLMRGRSGFLSLAHTPADIATTTAAFDAALADLAVEGL
jgi:glutamate-1-semialdehyde 2,1-aminomutase